MQSNGKGEEASQRGSSLSINDLSIRDWFAGQALSLGEGVWCGDNIAGMAARCYAIADAMLQARSEPHPDYEAEVVRLRKELESITALIPTEHRVYCSPGGGELDEAMSAAVSVTKFVEAMKESVT